MNSSSILNLLETLGVLFLAFVGLSLSYLGYIWVFTPDVQLARLDMTAESIPGMSVVRSVLGSGLFTFAAMCFLFIKDRDTWFKPLLLFAILLFLARMLSLISDGLHERMVLYAVLEGLIVFIVVFLHRKGKSNSTMDV